MNLINGINLSKLWTQIELTDLCNLRCIMCEQGGKVFWNLRRDSVHGEYKKGFMDINLFEKIIKDFSKFKITFSEFSPFWLGEPMIHPDFPGAMHILEKANKTKRLFNFLQIHTNGQICDEIIANSLIKAAITFKSTRIFFSIDAATESTYKTIRIGGSLQKVFNTIQLILHFRKKFKAEKHIRFIFQFIVMPENHTETFEFISIFKNLYSKLNYPLKIITKPLQHQLANFSEQFDAVFFEVLNSTADMKQNNFILYKNSLQFLKNRNLAPTNSDNNKIQSKISTSNKIKPCMYPFYSPHIDRLGNLTVCCLDNKLDLKLGNLQTESFYDIWFSKKADRLRLAHINNEFKEFERCEICIKLGQRAQNKNEQVLNDQEINTFLSYKTKID